MVMLTKNQNSVVRIMLVIAFFAGALGVQPAQAASVDFGWARGMGGTGYDGGYNIALDADGNVYVLGVFSNTVDFDPGAGISNLTSLGSTDVFINKFDNNGNFVWAKSLGGSLSDGGLGLAMDGSGNIYIAGYFRDTVDFDPGAGTHYLTSNGGSDIFIVKLDNNGGFVWAGSMGSASEDLGADIVFGNSGSIYLTGRFGGTVDFDPGAGTYNLTSAGGWDIFVSKLDGDGNHVWTKSMGGTSNDQAFEIISDASGNVYTTGQFSDTADFDPGAGTNNLTSAGGRDIFVSKLDANGNFVWAKGMGGASTDAGNDIVLDGNGYVYLAGDFDGTADFDPGAGTAFLTGSGISDVFISKLDNNGNFVWAKGIGGTNFDMGTRIALDGDGFLNVTGYFGNTVDFDPGTGVSNLTSTGDIDIFVAQFDSNGIFIWAKNMGGSFFEGGNDILVDGNRNIYVVGEFQNIVDFDPGTGTNNLTSMGDNDIFIVKLNAVSQVYYVTKTPDTNDGICDDDCSLREAIAVTASGDTINFAPSLSGQTITLSSTLVIDKDLTIDGSALASMVSVSGNNSVRVLKVNSGTTVTLDSLIIRDGFQAAEEGGGILNLGTSNVINSIISENTARHGGGITNVGVLNITDSTISGNSASGPVNQSADGGGMLNFGTLNISKSMISANSANQYGGGGGVFNFGNF